MNDLATHLRNAATDWDGLPGHDDEEIIHYITCKKAREIADHIDAQEALIGEMREALVGLVTNENYNGEALHDAGVWDAAYTKAISAISKSRQEG